MSNIALSACLSTRVPLEWPPQNVEAPARFRNVLMWRFGFVAEHVSGARAENGADRARKSGERAGAAGLEQKYGGAGAERELSGKRGLQKERER